MKPVERKLKGILIDVVEAEVREVEVVNGECDWHTLKSIREHIRCNHIEAVYDAFRNEYPDKGCADIIFVDDEGLFNPESSFFFIPGLAQPIAGNGLIIGGNFETGETIGHTMSKKNIEFLKENTIFLHSKGEVQIFMRLLNAYNTMQNKQV